MKIRKALSTILILSLIVLSSISGVSGEERDPGAARTPDSTNPITTTTQP